MMIIVINTNNSQGERVCLHLGDQLWESNAKQHIMLQL
jgi:hypothetical protein